MSHCSSKNEYIPYPATIEDIKQDTADTKTFRVSFADTKLTKTFEYEQGQFMEVSVLGVGEAPISITSSPSRKGFLEFTIRSTGKVTDGIHAAYCHPFAKMGRYITGIGPLNHVGHRHFFLAVDSPRFRQHVMYTRLPQPGRRFSVLDANPRRGAGRRG